MMGLPRLVVCGTHHPTLFIVLQPRGRFLLPIVRVPCEMFARHEHGTHHFLFLLESLILVGCSWECRALKQVFHEDVARSELQFTRTAAARAQPGNVVNTVIECATLTIMRNLMEMTSYSKNSR